MTWLSERPRTRQIMVRFWREWMRPFLIILVLMGSFRSAVADWNHVPTGSMKPTILIGDRIFVNKIAYDLKIPFTRVHLAEWGKPKRGDLIVFLSPADGKRLVKRVIGIPGDRLEMRDNHLIVNGTPADYEPLDAEIVEQIEDPDRDEYRFAAEVIDDLTHPIMTSPWRPSKNSFTRDDVIEDGHYFVMGDNRDESFDSRWFGLVPEERILGRAIAVAISVDPKKFYLPRWGRFFSSLP